jgi:hypothetical protein
MAKCLSRSAACAITVKSSDEPIVLFGWHKIISLVLSSVIHEYVRTILASVVKHV